MWVFDGEEWTQDDGNIGGGSSKAATKQPRYDERMPELQVIEVEIVPVPARQIPVPPFTLP